MTGQFVIVRSEALYDPEMLKSPTLFMTLCYLSTMTTQVKGGWCYFKQKTIADRLGKSRQAISKNLNRLKELGYIEIKQQNFKGRQSNNLYRLVYDEDLTAQREVAPMPQREVAPSAQREVAPKRYLYLKDKERERTLTREEFLRGVNKGFHEKRFNGEFSHLTENEIQIQGEECFDRWGGDLKGRDPVLILRSWLRKGLNIGTVRKASKKDKQESQAEAVYKEPDNPLQDWHTLAQGIVPKNVFRKYLRPAWVDERGNLCVSEAYHTSYIRQQAWWFELIRIMGHEPELLHQPFTQKELEHA